MVTFDDIMKYSPENEKVFEELSTLCIDKKIVPYVGAGLSAFARYIPDFKDCFLFPTWEQLIDKLYKDCFDNKERTIGEIEAADEIENELGKDVFYERLRLMLGGDLSEQDWNTIIGESKNQAVSTIPKLFHSPIVTTNFDQILEKIHNDEITVSFPYNTKELDNAINNRKRLIYKIHGCVSDAKNIVLAKSKYEEVYSANSELVKSLSEYIQGFHFLFLGCSLKLDKDKDYSTILIENLQKTSGMYHFAILPCNESEFETRRIELENRNIYPIFYNSEIDKNHISVRMILDELLKKYNDRLFQIPQYNSQYIEREDSVIEKIKKILIDNEFSACTITGLGGIGKTRVMSEYARNIEKTNTRVFWFNVLSADNVKNEICQFALKNNLITATEKDYNYIYQVFKNWLKENKNWLFLLDNVENYEDIRIFFDFDNTIEGKRHILLTSRKENELSNCKSIPPLNTFNQNESLKLLESNTNKTPDQYAKKIAELLDGLPLALEQAAVFIREENESYKNYLALLEKDTSISTLEKKRLSHTESVGATYNISILRIKSKAAKELLNLSAYLPPNAIDISVLQKHSDCLPNSLSDAIQNESILNEIICEITKYSLLSKSGSFFSMHRLLQEVIRNNLDKSDTSFGICICNVYKKIFEYNFRDKNGVLLFGLEDAPFEGELYDYEPHLQWLMKYFPNSEELGNAYINYGHSALNACSVLLRQCPIYYKQGDKYFDKGDYLQALEQYEHAFSIETRCMPEGFGNYNPKQKIKSTVIRYAIKRFCDDKLTLEEREWFNRYMTMEKENLSSEDRTFIFGKNFNAFILNAQNFYGIKYLSMLGDVQTRHKFTLSYINDSITIMVKELKHWILLRYWDYGLDSLEAKYPFPDNQNLTILLNNLVKDLTRKKWFRFNFDVLSEEDKYYIESYSKYFENNTNEL